MELRGLPTQVAVVDFVTRVTGDHLVVIPAGEPHATLARAGGRVAYFLVTEEQE